MYSTNEGTFEGTYVAMCTAIYLRIISPDSHSTPNRPNRRALVNIPNSNELLQQPLDQFLAKYVVYVFKVLSE